MPHPDTFPAERTAVLTGAASARGIGRATAEMLASDGWSVAILDIDGQATQQIDLFMRENQVLALFLEAEKLLDQIEMGRKAGNKRNTEQEEYGPYLVLDTESTPPSWCGIVHSTPHSTPMVVS